MVQPEELTDKICIIDTGTFLSRILPVATKDIDGIFHRLTSRNAIFLPKEDGSADGDWYVTVRVLSIVRAAMMTGRATVNWQVTKMGENETWRPDDVLKEAQFRARAPPESNLCQIIRSVGVGADTADQASVVVDIEHYVRHGLHAPSDPDSEPPPKKRKLSAEPESTEVVLVVVDPATEDTAGRVSESARRARFRFTSRVLTRTLMSTYGWPVKFFRDHRELVETIRDAVEGHRDLWFGGALHRDVRAPPRESHHSQTPEKTGTKAFMSAEVLSNQPNWPDTVRDTEKYVNGHILHSAIHDLESFFWILVYLCLTRAGPGGGHRDPPEDSKACARLDHIVTCLFTSDDDLVLARNKHDLFQSPEDMRDFIVPQFHPYFQCLSNLVLDWWNILQLAYRTYDALTPAVIHQQVLDVLDDALKALLDPTAGPLETEAKLTQREDDRRLADLDNIGTGIKYESGSQVHDGGVVRISRLVCESIGDELMSYEIGDARASTMGSLSRKTFTMILELPPEILVMVLRRLSLGRDFAHIAMACRKLHKLVMETPEFRYVIELTVDGLCDESSESGTVGLHEIQGRLQSLLESRARWHSLSFRSHEALTLPFQDSRDTLPGFDFFRDILFDGAGFDGAETVNPLALAALLPHIPTAHYRYRLNVEGEVVRFEKFAIDASRDLLVLLE
ncbi:hypothetical protein EVG20_g9843 [Dentipellis fragilis]|uniref:F-box domain-containing protein n=1 Tax=Dentipellis fragilis TaxID=205917 RepID=A0A4Y9XVK3_9AGAM|nr:hypothetical protein EVG20_g9843 [Dentipellis fragilis]